MTKHVVEALLIGLVFLSAAHLSPAPNQWRVVCAALAVAAFAVGLILAAGG